ncbi:MAG: tRNA (guanosine(46)-N7)-methyltransferase TrmB [Brumimicrobium sp.]
MSKNKLFRFAEMKEMDHVFEPPLDRIKNGTINYKGNWNQNVFKNDNPIILELGCGKGEYAVGLAKKYPNKNFVGVDIKGARMWVGAKQCLEEGIKNVVFLRTKVDFINKLFGKNEVSEIWLTFSDPQPNKPNKRLTSKIFVDRYREILKPGGIIHLKTDSDILFESTEIEIKENKYNCTFFTWDLYGEIENLPESIKDILHIKTHYEELFTARGHQIKYCQFQIN